MDIRTSVVLLVAGFEVDLMHNLNHFLKTRDIAGQGPFSEDAITLFILILLGHWGQG